jgi:hypothetical protein
MLAGLCDSVSSSEGGNGCESRAQPGVIAQCALTGAKFGSNRIGARKTVPPMQTLTQSRVDHFPGVLAQLEGG